MRFVSSKIVVAASLVVGQAVGNVALGQAPAASDDWNMEMPLTGRALPCENGKIKEFDCENVELLSFLPPSVMGNAGGTDIWGWIDSTTKREFAIVAGGTGTAFVEVTDPINPKYLGKLPLHGGVRAGGAPGIKVYKNHAFIVVEGTDHGMQVFDLTQLRDVKNAPAEFTETAHYPNFANAHTITMNEETGFAYPTGITGGGETCGGGLHMIDVRTPTKPTFAGCYSHDSEGGLMGPGYIHDTRCIIYRGPDQEHKGKEICFNSSGSAVVIVDVTDKQNPKQIGLATYPNVGYAHQGWFTEDGRYFFLDDEIDDAIDGVEKTRTIVFDMLDLDDPVVLTEFHGNTDATDHNLYIRGHYMYQSNYTAGLRIIDVKDPKNPKEVGFLDTAPELEGPGMNTGSWGNFPFFKDDVVANADKNGLFLVRLKNRTP